MSNKNSRSEIRLFELSKSQLEGLDFTKRVFVIPITTENKILFLKNDDGSLSLPNSYLPRYDGLELDESDFHLKSLHAGSKILSEMGEYRSYTTIGRYFNANIGPTKIVVLEANEIPPTYRDGYKELSFEETLKAALEPVTRGIIDNVLRDARRSLLNK